MSAVTVIGIGADGCASLTSRAMAAVSRAQVLVGGERQLAFFPEFEGERICVRGRIAPLMDRIAQLAEEDNVVILASGDPMFFGIGNHVIAKLGAEHVQVIPQPSAMQWAFARVGLSWHDAELFSLHGRPIAGLVARLKFVQKAACFTDQENSPARIAAWMLDWGETEWKTWVCEQLGGPGERVRSFELAELASCGDIGALNVLVLLRKDNSWRPPRQIPYLDEELFSKRMPKRGLITKREVRVLALALLHLREDSVIWDIGAGSGSVAIEAAHLAHLGRVFAIEIDPEGVEICKENIRRHGSDNVEVIAGRAPEALSPLPDPDAIFIGGSKGSLNDIIAVSLDRLRPGGRVVVAAVTLDNVAEAYQSFRSRNIVPEVTLLGAARGAPLARYLRYDAQNPIHIFATTREPA